MAFLRGLWAPFRGVAYVARHGLWLYVLAPLALNAALIFGTVVLGHHVVRQWLAPGVLGVSALANIGLWVVSVALGVVFFVVLQPALSAPFLDTLTEKVETIERGAHPRVGVLIGAWQALKHGLLKLFCYVVALAVALALTVFTGVGGGLVAVVSSVLLAYDGFDFPLARRGASFRGKWKYLLLHPGQTLGYCVGATLLYLVPLALLIAPAFAAVGATLAFLDSSDTSEPNTDGGTGPLAAAAPLNEGEASSQ
jgi:uncharacterized protein involved in cysteine biosynthesis